MKKITNCKYELKFDYYVTEEGRIYSDRTKKYLAEQLDQDGYVKVRMMSTDGKRHRYSVHRLVMENFNPIEDMENYQVNHIDGNKRNNTLTNLEWTTCQENIDHAMKNNLRAKVNGAAKITPEQVIEIYERANSGESNVALGKEFGLHPDSIGKIKNKKIWKKVIENYLNESSTTISEESTQ